MKRRLKQAFVVCALLATLGTIYVALLDDPVAQRSFVSIGYAFCIASLFFKFLRPTWKNISASPSWSWLDRILPRRLAEEDLGDLLEEIAAFRRPLSWRRRGYISLRVGELLVHGAVETARSLFIARR
jgi:hypothetical protein